MDTNTPIAINAVAYSPTNRGLRRWPSIAPTSTLGRIDAFGTKLRCCGNAHAAKAAKVNATSALPNMAQRQEVTSNSAAGMRRPLKPPMELPAMYRPIAPGRSRESSSSDNQVMATAGVPAMSAPCTARRAMS